MIANETNRRAEAGEALEANGLDLERLEASRPEGLTSAEILEVFRQRGIAFSEATLRKYVQLGLLPRSIRVGEKGKHRGSRGLYPAQVVRRILLIKQMMAERHTIEQIKGQFLFLAEEIDRLEDTLRGIVAKLTGVSRVGAAKLPARSDLRAVTKLGRELTARLRKLDADLRGQKGPLLEGAVAEGFREVG